MIIKLILVFCAGMVVDVLWTHWMRSVMTKKAEMAGLVSATLGAISLLGVGAGLSYWPLAVAWVAGLGYGSYLAIVYAEDSNEDTE